MDVVSETKNSMEMCTLARCLKERYVQKMDVISKLKALWRYV